MKPVAWGVLSVSSHYALRVSVPLRDSPHIRLHAIASRSSEKAAAAASALGFEKAYGTYEQLLADPEIEAVYIPLPNHLHLEWIRKAADAGKHILCEKPIAMNAEEAIQCAEYARSKNVLLMEAFAFRFHPQWLRVRDLVRIGEIGDVHAIHVVFSYMLPDPKNIRNILGVGGGGLLDIGCYAVCSSRFLLGREPQRVVSLVARDPSSGTDILSSAILDFGRTRTIFTVATQTQGSQRMDILGSGGQISIPLCFNMYPDSPMSIVVVNGTGLGPRTVSFASVDQYGLEFESFSRAVRDGGPVPFDAHDAVANMQVLDAIFRSEKTGGWEAVR
jgi:predicted dehydrogenase